VPTVQEIINTNTIDDDQLRMMFVCCHPSLCAEAQVSLILKTRCGFSIAEIAKAFVSNHDTIEKDCTGQGKVLGITMCNLNCRRPWN